MPIRSSGSVSCTGSGASCSGTLTGLSFGYRALRARQGARRVIEAAELIEISLVAQPMQPLARIDAVADG